MDRAWRVYLAVCGCALLGYAAAPAGGPRAAAQGVVAAAAVLAVRAGVRRHRPPRRAPWVLVAAGLVLWAAAAAAGAAGAATAAGLLHVAGYPVLAFALARLAGLHRRPRDVAGALDSAVVTIGLGLLAWVALVGPALRADDVPPGGRLVAVALPPAALLLLAVVARTVTAPGARAPAVALLVAAAVVPPVADTAHLLLGAPAAGPLPDAGRLASSVLWGAAALHPAMRRTGQHDGPAAPRVGRLRLAALLAAVLTAPLALAAQTAVGVPPDVWAFVVGSCTLFGLVVVRMGLALRVVTAAHGERERLADTLAHAAAHDPLTELANRGRALELVDAALHRARRAGGVVGLLFVDLDHFKRVNDTYGHRAGDLVLRTTAQRMRDCVRAGDRIGRLGGDEFVVVVDPAASERDVVALAERIVEAVAEPVVVDAHGATAVVGASVGIAVSHGGGTDAVTLLHDADVAAYRAKSAGRGRAEIYDDALRADTVRRAELEAGLRRALAEDGFELHYQPLFDALDRQVTGYEALLRWRRGDGTIVPPDAFLPDAEQSSLADDIGRWVLDRATAQLARWRREDPAFRDVTVAVNVSARHLLGGITRDVERALAASGLPADRLVLEVSEAALVHNPAVGVQLDGLRGIGVRVAIDEFGAGLSSVGQLHNLRADLLKIDHSLVAASSPGGRALLGLLVHAAHLFGLRVVAEGVEHEADLGPLREAGCDEVQGYLLARPMPAETVPAPADAARPAGSAA